MSKLKKTIFKLRRDTSENWFIANPILQAGEPAYEIDTQYLKIGNGIDDYNTLKYIGKVDISDIPIATKHQKGAVVSSDGDNQILVLTNGKMEINCLTISKIEQKDNEQLFINCGTSTSVL